jgi:antitoxin CptB
MTGTTRSSADLDPRRRRILFRAWHRGTREADLILGQFADSEIGAMDEAALDRLEALMEEADADIVKWVTGEQPVPERHDNDIFAHILRERARLRPSQD